MTPRSAAGLPGPPSRHVRLYILKECSGSIKTLRYRLAEPDAMLGEELGWTASTKPNKLACGACRAKSAGPDGHWLTTSTEGVKLLGA